MAYGNAQRLGETINPQFMQVDFSPYERAGQTMGNAFAQAGADIGGAIKQTKQNEREIKKSEQMAKSIRDAIPELAPMAENALAELNNPDLTTNQKLAIAAGIQDSLKIGILGLDRQREASLMDWEKEKFNRQMGLSEQELAMSIAAAGSMPMKPPTVEEFGVEGGKQKLVWNGYTGKWEYPELDAGEEAISPPDGVMPQGTPIIDTDQGRISLPMRQQGEDLAAQEIATMAAMTPQVGQYPDYGSFEEAMNLKEGDGVLPDKNWQKAPKPPKIGFEPTQPRESDKPQEIKLPDGSTGYGTFKDNVFQPAVGPDGKPLVIPKQLDPKTEMDMAKANEETRQKAITALDQSEQFLKSLENLEKHEGFKNLFGTNIGVPTFVPGSSGADAKAELEKVNSKAFMESIQYLKGLGALSNAEGEKASSAFIALKPSMSEEAARKSIKEAKDIITMGMARARKRLEGQPDANEEISPDDAAASRLQMLLQGQ